VLGCHARRTHLGKEGTSVNRIIRAYDDLRQASGLPAVLDAAYNAFEDILPVLRTYDDPADGGLAAFAMSAASAADARDAIGWAPSLPPRRLGGPPAPDDEPQPDQTAGEAAEMLAGVTRLLAARLAQAGRFALSDRDCAACADAWQHAQDIHALLTGTEP
jgi:hypothetical protein